MKVLGDQSSSYRILIRIVKESLKHFFYKLSASMSYHKLDWSGIFFINYRGACLTINLIGQEVKRVGGEITELRNDILRKQN